MKVTQKYGANDMWTKANDKWTEANDKQAAMEKYLFEWWVLESNRTWVIIVTSEYIVQYCNESSNQEIIILVFHIYMLYNKINI